MNSTDLIPSRRGQSEVIGALLLVSIVVLGLGVILITGLPSLSDANAQEPVVENSLNDVASAGERVAAGTSDSESVSLDDGTSNPDSFNANPNAGSITVTIEDTSGSSSTTYISAPLGSLTYDLEDGSTLAYQGGGVFRGSASTDGNRRSSSVVTAPPLTLRDTSNTLATFSGSFITLSSNTGLSDEVVLTESSNSQYFTQKRASSSEIVRITIQSRYYRAWYNFFVNNIGIPEADAAVDDSTNTVEVIYGDGEEFFINPSRVDLLLSD